MIRHLLQEWETGVGREGELGEGGRGGGGLTIPAFPRSSHTGDLKTGTLVASLPGTCHYWVIAGTGQPGVSIP